MSTTNIVFLLITINLSHQQVKNFVNSFVSINFLKKRKNSMWFMLINSNFAFKTK